MDLIVRNENQSIIPSDNDSKRRQADAILEPPKITVFYPCNKETPICFKTAAQCWQLMHSNDILQIDFGQLLMNLPMAVKSWLNRFLVDLAVYLGRGDEAHSILKDTKLSNLEKNLRNLSLTVSQPPLNVSMFCDRTAMPMSINVSVADDVIRLFNENFG